MSIMNQSAGERYEVVGIRYGQMRRKYRRAGFPGFVGDIADGNQVIGGMIEDISTGGFKITNIPGSFKAEKHTYSAVISGGGKHYRLLVKPCWQKEGKDQNQVEMGFKILDAPWEWVAMTVKEIPEFDYADHFRVFN